MGPSEMLVDKWIKTNFAGMDVVMNIDTSSQLKMLAQRFLISGTSVLRFKVRRWC